MRIHWAAVSVGAIAAMLSFAASESMSGQQSQKQSVTFGVSGRLQKGLANGKPGIFELAECQEQSGIVFPVTVKEFGAGINSATMQRKREEIVRKAVLADGQGMQINFACFSWGATLCLRVVQDLAGLTPPVPVETIVLVDRIDLGYPGEKPKNGINGNPVVPDNVKIVFAVRQEYSSPCLGFLCGGAVTSTADGPQLKQILMSANSPDPEGPALLDRVLEEYRAAHGGDLPNNATDLHKFMDQSQTIRELSGAWVGRPCTRRKCGNGRLNQGEECDDGNTAIGDGCRADCTLERCGDVIPDPGEQCDDGNLVDGDGCDSNCTLTGCGNGIVTTGEQCDGSVDSACPGRCIPPGQENECQCRPLDLSGTWSIYLAGPVTGTGQERICNLCPDPPDTGPLCQDSSGAGILMYPHIISSDSFGRGINVQQTGNSLAYEAQGPCGAHDFCTDTLTGSINGNSVSLVLTQEKDISGDFSRRAIGATTHRISGTIISSTRIVGDDDISVERRDRYECHTYDATSMSDEPGPVEITISPAP